MITSISYPCTILIRKIKYSKMVFYLTFVHCLSAWASRVNAKIIVMLAICKLFPVHYSWSTAPKVDFSVFFFFLFIFLQKICWKKCIIFIFFFDLSRHIFLILCILELQEGYIQVSCFQNIIKQSMKGLKYLIQDCMCVIRTYMYEMTNMILISP